MAINQGSLKDLLSREQIDRVRKSKKEIQEVKGSLEMLKKLGLDVKVLEDKILWTEEVQDTLLKEFDKV